MSYSDSDSDSDSFSNSNSDNGQNILEAFYNGQLYHPSVTHYPNIGNPNEVVVQCDKCGLSNLNVCIGYKSVDLCLDCYEVIDVELHDSYVRSDSYYNIFHNTNEIANCHNKYLESKGINVFNFRELVNMGFLIHRNNIE